MTTIGARLVQQGSESIVAVAHQRLVAEAQLRREELDNVQRLVIQTQLLCMAIENGRRFWFDADDPEALRAANEKRCKAVRKRVALLEMLQDVQNNAEWCLTLRWCCQVVNMTQPNGIRITSERRHEQIMKHCGKMSDLLAHAGRRQARDRYAKHLRALKEYWECVELPRYGELYQQYEMQLALWPSE